MKYTKKQLIKAYAKWTTDLRINPSSFRSEEEVSKQDVKDYSKECVDTLLGYIE